MLIILLEDATVLPDRAAESRRAEITTSSSPDELATQEPSIASSQLFDALTTEPVSTLTDLPFASQSYIGSSMLFLHRKLNEWKVYLKKTLK